MTKALIATLVLMVAVSFRLPALANDAEKGQRVTGTITSVDAPTNSITVETTKKQNVTCTVDAQTMITVSGKTVALADLKVGQKVTLEVQGGKALSIKASGQ